MEITTFREKCCSFFTALLTVVLVGGASTVYATELELNEGAPGGNIITDGDTDWSNIFEVVGGAGNVPTAISPLPANYSQAVFVRDFVPGASGPDISTFTTGSKDTLPITPGWECTRSNNVNDKTDIVNAYATAYIDPISGDLYAYFALERYSNEGTGNVGFWFLKNDDVGCAVGPTGPKTLGFTGDHEDGDTLVVAEFATGGDLDSVIITAYRWERPGAGPGSLNTTPLAAAGECVGDGAGQNLCGVVNKQTIVAPAGIPWLTETKEPGNTPSNDLEEAEFFEGKINLTALGLEGCFSKYMGVTRSSTSLTATLFDYALGDFNLCSIDVAKVCRAGTEQSPNPVIHPDGDKVITIFDAVITNTGASAVTNVTIVEDINILTEAHEVCNVTAVDGNPITPVDISSTPYEVLASLAKGADVDVEITCLTDENGFPNTVEATAKTSVGSSITLDDTATATACALIPDRVLNVVKECSDGGIRIVYDDIKDLLTLEVEVDIAVSNAPDAMQDPPAQQEKLVDVSVINNEKGDGSGPSIKLYLADENGNYVDEFGVIVDAANRVEFLSTDRIDLAVDETAYFKSVYVPTDVDGGINGGVPADGATFTDKVVANGVGALSGQSISAFDTDTCEVCPADEEE